ncbi:hypothetical protein H2248_005515 [Termitomyces sp. 'cryptogamus']|nr:hypothetical protein H2248_005515 [Termitomyces sp. 'cryptogamus']
MMPPRTAHRYPLWVLRFDSMAKRVSFAQVNAAYSPIPSTPSPTFSTSSLTSLSDPPTPPMHSAPIFHPRSTFKTNKSPVSNPSLEGMNIHFFLAFNPLEGSLPALDYDITRPPTFLLDSQITLPEFHEAATEPPLPALYITYPTLLSPISVFAGDVGYVTISDVLHAIYHAFLVQTTTEEYQHVPMQLLPEVNTAYYVRCERAPDTKTQLHWGIKRIDLLRGRHRFLGLSGTLHGRDIWLLNVD